MIEGLKRIALVTMLLGFIAAGTAYQIGFVTLLPQATLADGRTVPYPIKSVQLCLKKEALALLDIPGAVGDWHECRDYFAWGQALFGFELRALTVACSGLIGLLALFVFALAARFEQKPVKVVRGPRLRTDRKGLRAFAKACALECKRHGRGLELPPPHALGRERETRHFLILGSVGGGKTQTMLNLILGAIARDDTVLVLDTKGDMMAGLPGAPMLVAPHDRRSLMWDIASDCRTKQDARELAARFIPASPDPMWSEAAREIFVACIVHLQAIKICLWDWANLNAAVNSDVAMLTQFAKDHNPSAACILAHPVRQSSTELRTPGIAVFPAAARRLSRHRNSSTSRIPRYCRRQGTASGRRRSR